MNTDEIERFLKADTDCQRVFQGVYSVDTLPDHTSLLVCNIDKSTKPGQHWITIHVMMMEVENIAIRLDVGLLNNSKPT